MAPREEAVHSAKVVTKELIVRGWKHKEGRAPGTADTDKNDLPAIRLRPPSKDVTWFCELLAVPAKGSKGQQWLRVSFGKDHYGLPSFEFMALTSYKPLEADCGIKYARPSMMALANMLSHSELTEQTMSGGYGGREIRRCAKDLGRVLALARLSGEETEHWVDEWEAGLKDCFSNRWKALARDAGKGFNELLSNSEVFEEAHFTCVMSLLSSRPPSIEELMATGKRLKDDAIEPLVERVAHTSKIS